MSEENKDLETMLSSGTFENAAGEKYPLRPFPFGSIATVAKSVANLTRRVLEMPDNMLTDIGGMLDSEKIDPMVLAFALDLFGDAMEDVYVLESLCVGQDVEWVKKLDPDDGITLTILTYKVNKTFFTKRLKPFIKTLMAQNGQAGHIAKVLLNQDGAK